MELFVCAIVIFIVSFIFQIFCLMLSEKNKKKKLKELTIEDEYNRNIKFAIKIILALIISIILCVVTFYGIGILTLFELRKGH